VTAVGYGGDRPIASNDSDENRARNRRIEIVVK
ncbi:MAG: flagellar motor protein MotB, partial [Alphaproteobacteria bacterium]|nr:flagellar motor protein MotB [Alphaproteobacteria bacterium]